MSLPVSYCFQDLESPAANDDLQKVYVATVEEVISGDSVVLLLPSGESRRVYFASIRCLRPSGPNKSQSREDEAIALEAKELVRKKTIGKTVKVWPVSLCILVFCSFIVLFLFASPTTPTFHCCHFMVMQSDLTLLQLCFFCFFSGVP